MRSLFTTLVLQNSTSAHKGFLEEGSSSRIYTVDPLYDIHGFDSRYIRASGGNSHFLLDVTGSGVIIEIEKDGNRKPSVVRTVSVLKN